MSGRIFYSCLLAIVFALSVVRAHGAVPTADASLSSLIQLVLASNPDLAAISLQVDALDEAVQGSRRWMDPRVSIEYSNAPWNAPTLGNSPMSGLQLRVQQSFPAPGVNDAREAVAQAQLNVQSAALTEAQAHLVASVRIAYWRLSHTRAQQMVTTRHIGLVQELLAAVEARYTAGYADQGALLRLRLLNDRLEDSLGDFDRDAKALTAALNAAVGKKPEQSVETAPLSTALPPPQASSDILIETAHAQRGELARHRAEAAVARGQSTLAAYERRPELSAWIGYRVRVNTLTDGGTDFFSLGIGLPLPFDYSGRWDATRRSANLRAMAAEQRYESAVNSLAADLTAALATWARAHDRARSYTQDLLPLAQSAVDSLLTSFQTGRADFESLYQAEIALLELERAILISKLETHVQNATVGALIGDIE